MLSTAAVMEASHEWTVAREVQQRFMRYSGPAIEMLDYSARCRQVKELGGDFYDFAALARSRLALAIGDASGKGLPAALMISNVQSSLRTAALFTGNNGPKALRAVNRQVYESSLADRYATLFFGVFDQRQLTLRYVNAGHHPPMVIRRNGSILWLETGGAPVGMFPDWIYEEGAVQLEPGDVVVAYTDGVIEAANPDGEEWGIDSLRKAAVESGARCADDMIQAIFTSMDEFSNGRQADDATVAVLQVC
jgi:sigma-B regulation protein RsbU (phosphoserine phosphatase)